MAKRTKKVGITGRYGTRYGDTLRKRVKRIEALQRKKYLCPHCGKTGVRRTAAGIWQCRPCGRTYAGGCWQFQTGPGISVLTTIQHLRSEKTE